MHLLKFVRHTQQLHHRCRAQQEWGLWGGAGKVGEEVVMAFIYTLPHRTQMWVWKRNMWHVLFLTYPKFSHNLENCVFNSKRVHTPAVSDNKLITSTNAHWNVCHMSWHVAKTQRKWKLLLYCINDHNICYKVEKSLADSSSLGHFLHPAHKDLFTHYCVMLLLLHGTHEQERQKKEVCKLANVIFPVFS